MSGKKRERSVNFSREEVELLTKLVTQHKDILENKKIANYLDKQLNTVMINQIPLNCFSVDYQPTQKDDSDYAPPQKRKISEYQATPKKTAFDEDNDEKKWSSWKPKSLRSKKHPALSATKMKRLFEQVAESKLEIAELQKTILEEELLNKRKQWAFEEEEREHKKQIWHLEKKYWMNKS